VWRALWSFLRGESASEDEGDEGYEGELSLAQAIALALEFVEPLVLQAAGSSTKCQTDSIREVRRSRESSLSLVVVCRR
jgi:hypothetical protein